MPLRHVAVPAPLVGEAARMEIVLAPPLVALTVRSLARIAATMVGNRRVLRRMRALVLAVLLLVPVVSSGHHHVTTESSAPCAVCIAAHHAPAVLSVPPAAVALALALTTTSPPVFETPAHRVHSPNAGRAPPYFFSPLSVS